MGVHVDGSDCCAGCGVWVGLVAILIGIAIVDWYNRMKRSAVSLDGEHVVVLFTFFF
jgi:hypothetical protein